MSPSDICDGVAMTGDVDLPSPACVARPDLGKSFCTSHRPSTAAQHYDVAGRKAMPRAVFFIHRSLTLQHDEPPVDVRGAGLSQLPSLHDHDGDVSELHEGPRRRRARPTVFARGPFTVSLSPRSSSAGGVISCGRR